MSVFQALAEALTTSKGMVGRRLLDCSDLWPLESECNKIVNGVIGTWEKEVKKWKGKYQYWVDLAGSRWDLYQKYKDLAGSRWDLYQKFKGIAEYWEAKAGSRWDLYQEWKGKAGDALNEIKDWTDKWQDAVKEIDELGGEIANLGDEIQDLVKDVGAFADNLEKKLVDFVKLTSPAQLMQLAIAGIKETLSNEDGVCLPSCPGDHINSGEEQDLVPGLDDLKIRASHHMIAHAYRILPAHATR